MGSKIHLLLGLEPWRAYERAMLNDLYYRFRAPEYEVDWDVRHIVGRLSLARRQVDVAVFETKHRDRPWLVVECKRYRRKLDVNDVGCFAAKLEDIGGEQGVLVCPMGFSTAALNFAAEKGIAPHEVTLESADRLNWRDIAHQAYPWDEYFHPEMGDAFYTIDRSNQVDDWIASLEELAFEEWEGFIKRLREISPGRWHRLLTGIAQAHYDDAWRFNAVRLLLEQEGLPGRLRDSLMEYETDPDTLELLAGGSE